MFDRLKKLTYGARVVLARGGKLEMVDVNGRPTQVRHGGEGPPFFYLHSGLGETIWLPFLEKWSKQFEVFAPAHPGFAKSEGLDGISGIEDAAFHYVELFDVLGIEKACIGGVSLGGWIAAEFACRWPERVAKLWIADAPGLWVPEQPLPDLFRHAGDVAAIRGLLFHDPQSYLAEMIIKEREKLNDESLLAVYQSMAGLARFVWERPYDPKLANRLHRVQSPTLLVWGESDRLVPLAYGQAYARHLPNARLHVIKECGHLPMFEKEAEFVAAIADFCGMDAADWPA